MATLEFTVGEAWKQHYPEAAVGILALESVTNPSQHPVLEARKQALEQDLRRRFGDFDRAGLRQLPTLQAYHDYYKRFKKSYHVQLQLESILFRDRSIPRVAALVESMFMAELKNQLLTAGHDLQAVVGPFGIDMAAGGERYIKLDGQEQTLKRGDMFIADLQGVMSSVIYGPDRRTQIRPETTTAVFTVYAPAGVSQAAVADHLDDIRAYVALFSPDLTVLQQRVYAAKDAK
jgi:DNA/RNA-binding domain of Phe-tRNA-synthetase-like protein